jgi:hypothetical protein
VGILGWAVHSTAPGACRQRLPQAAKDLTGGGFGVKYWQNAPARPVKDGDPPMNRSHAADDYETIRQRLEELRREREGLLAGPEGEAGKRGSSRESDAERRRRQRMEGSPPPWVPTIFVKSPRR